jgi:hypothetical protein
MRSEHQIINEGLGVLGVGVLLGILISPAVSTALFVCIGFYYAIAGVSEFLPGNQPTKKHSAPPRYSSKKPTQSIPNTTSAPVTDELTIAERIKNIHIKNNFKCPACGATVNPTDTKCSHCESYLVATANLPKPVKWADVEVGQTLQINQPHQGKIISQVLYRIYYGELWQKKMRPDIPWTLTGNYFVGLGLGQDRYLLNWQNRNYLLDTRKTLTDKDVNRYLAGPARKFASSNQTADVYLDYLGKQWQIEDIGRFRIEYVNGDGSAANAGTVGRFIHAKNFDRILVAEDFQSGGSSQDSLWTGYQIDEKDIQF